MATDETMYATPLQAVAVGELMSTGCADVDREIPVLINVVEVRLNTSAVNGQMGQALPMTTARSATCTDATRSRAPGQGIIKIGGAPLGVTIESWEKS